MEFFFSQQQELSSKVFAHLCDVVDDNKQFYDEKIHQISKMIILEGKGLRNSQTFICITSISYICPRFTSHWVPLSIIAIGSSGFTLLFLTLLVLTATIDFFTNVTQYQQFFPIFK